jgi:hypothetical protein
MYVSNVSSVYFVCCTRLDVSKVDRVLHMGCAWEAGGLRAVPMRTCSMRPRVGVRDAGTGKQHPGIEV